MISEKVNMLDSSIINCIYRSLMLNYLLVKRKEEEEEERRYGASLVNFIV